MNVYNRSNDPPTKRKIEFLALNYLAKAAPANLKDLGLSPKITSQMEEMFQLGLMNEAMSYHREAPVFERYISTALDQTFAKEAQGRFWLTDTTHFEPLFPIFFNVAETTETGNVNSLIGGWVQNITQALEEHVENNPQDYLSKYINPPLLFDLTPLLSDLIKTEGDPGNEEAFAEKKGEVLEALNEAIERTIVEFKTTHLESPLTSEDEQKLRVFLKSNIISVCRCEVGPENEGMGVLKRIDFFLNPDDCKLPDSMFAPDSEETFLNWKLKGKKNDNRFLSDLIADLDSRSKTQIESFVNHTGIRIGGVNGREKVFNFISLKELVGEIGGGHRMTEYAVHGRNVTAFKEKEEILDMALFNRFKTKMNDANFAQANPHIAILGETTAATIEGLMKDITEEKWTELNDNPDTRMIVQQSLYRMMQHLAIAENNTDNFTKYSQAIELISYEMATLLALSFPYKESDFQEIYKKQVNEMVPETLQDGIAVGLAKSAMNVFAGVNAAVLTQNPHPERVCDANSYFEVVSFIGENRTVQDVISGPEIKTVNLYAGEFNHNVNVKMSHSHYTAGSVINDIEVLLNQNKSNSEFGIERLTVALDVTIDFLKSKKAEELLKHFSQEITDGRLNFVFFRSGQKFDMLGIDNYYGSPFWMVNNGEPQWEEFNHLPANDIYKTDQLSMQWFCLVNKHAPLALDNYRKQIFDNARHIISQVPDDLKPNNGRSQNVRVSTVAKDMEPAFIDIKILNDIPEKTMDMLQELLYKKFAEKGVKIHSKGSFGFYHANFNVLPSKEDMRPRNIRINPGLDAEENQIIIDFIKDIPKAMRDLEERPI